MNFTHPIQDLIKIRVSVRSYSEQEIENNDWIAINNLIENISPPPFQTTCIFKAVKRERKKSAESKKIGTYGFIKNEKGYIIGKIPPTEQSLLDYGYQMERIILHLTDMGLGTCWLGASFTKSVFTQMIKAKKDEVVPAITAFGYPAERRRAFDSIVRFGAKSDKRKEFQTLFFHDNPDTPLSHEAAEAYMEVLSMVRLGPSASNQQPWRIIKEAEKNNFHFYIFRSKAYNKAQHSISGVDLHQVDIGIAMSHFELTCQTLGLNGNWQVTEQSPIPSHSKWEYAVSWYAS